MERAAEIIRGSPTLGSVAGGGHHPSRQFDGDTEGKIDSPYVAVLVKRIVSMLKFRQPRRPIGRVFYGQQRFDPPGHTDCIAAQRILSHSSFEERHTRTPRRVPLLALLPVERGERVVHDTCAAVEVLVLSFLCNF
jgi:hypothetical protein